MGVEGGDGGRSGLDWCFDLGLNVCLSEVCLREHLYGNGMGPDALGGLVIGSHVSGPVICRSALYPQKVMTCVATGDVDRGLSEIPQMFCADGLVCLVIGSHGSGPICTGGLVWFPIGFPVLGSGL